MTTRTLSQAAPTVRWADLGEVEEVVATIRWAFAQCRDWGHAWRPWRTEDYPDGSEDRTLKCRSCGTLRIEYLSARGLRDRSPRYEYPDGYLLGIGRLDPEAKAIIRHAMREQFIMACRKNGGGMAA